MRQGTGAAFCQPTRFLFAWLRDAGHRYMCGRRFGHFPVEDSFGCYRACSRCGTPLL